MRYVDTHTHLYDEAFSDAEADAAVKAAVEAGVDRMILPDIDSRERGRMEALAARHPGTLYVMAGLYPGSVDDNWQEEVSRVEKRLEDARDGLAPRIVAVGEIGLDYHYSKDTAPLQREAFRAQMELAARFHLPVDIHMRDATEDFFRILDDTRHLGLRGCLHAFSGSAETWRRLSRYGDWRTGIGGVVTFKNAHVADALEAIPLESMLLETDAPYLTPVPWRGRRNESKYIPVIADFIARRKGLPVETVAEVTTAGAECFFDL